MCRQIDEYKRLILFSFRDRIHLIGYLRPTRRYFQQTRLIDSRKKCPRRPMIVKNIVEIELIDASSNFNG